MTKNQFNILNIVAAVLAVLILTNVFLAQYNQKLSRATATRRDEVNSGQRAVGILQQMSVRIAQSADTDPRLRDLLLKYKLRSPSANEPKRP